MNIRETIAIISIKSLIQNCELETYSESELLRDKLRAVFSDRVYRRVKHLIDLVYISNTRNYIANDLKEELLRVGLNIDLLSISYLLDIDKIQHAFIKFSGIKPDITWDKLYTGYFNFLIPLYFYLKSEITYPIYWRKERRVWCRD